MSEQEPLFRVLRGTPTTEELAALVGVIVARSRLTGPAEPVTTPAWVRTGRPGAIGSSGMPTRTDVDAWRMSGLPR